MTSLLLLTLLSVGSARTLDKGDALPGLVEPPPPPPDPRASPPPVRAAVPLPIPEPVVHALSDGVTVQHVQIPGLRRVEVVVFLHQGSVALCGRPSPACAGLGHMLGLETQHRDAEAMESTLTLLDGELEGGMGLRDTTLRLAVPAEGLSQGLGLLREALAEPAFSKRELKLFVRDTLQLYETVYPTDPGEIARLVRDNAWFPADNPMGARPDLKGYSKLKPRTVSALHQKLLDEAPITVLVVGDVSWEALEPSLKATFAGLGKAGARPGPIPFTPPTQRRVVAVALDGQPQVSIRLRMAAPLVNADDRAAFQAVHFSLAGAFMSRLNRNIREEKGWTYGVRGRYNSQQSASVWDVGVDVAAENAAAAITEIQSEIKRFVSEGPTAVEVSSAAAGYIQSWNESLATSSSSRMYYADLVDDGDSVAAGARRLELMGGFSPEAVQAGAARWLGPDAAQLWVLVGDRAAIEAQLGQLGWTAEWFTPQQAVLGEL